MPDIKINISMPEPNKHAQPQSLLDKVKEYIYCCESYDLDSEYHWLYLKTIYTKLSEKPRLSSEQQNIIHVLDEFFTKHNNGSDTQHVNKSGADFWTFSGPLGK